MSARYGAIAVGLVLSAALATTACNALIGITDVPVPVDAASGGSSGGTSGVADASVLGDASISPDSGAAGLDGSVKGTADGGTQGTDAGADALGTGGDTGLAASDAAGMCGTDNNPHNCGFCGHDCLGGACMGGACQPVVLWPGDGGSQGQPNGLTQDDTYLYWLDIAQHTVFRTHKTTGATIDLLAPATNFTAVFPSAIAIDDSAVYWGDTGQIFRCAKTGCTAAGPVTIVSTNETIYSLAVDDTSIYWSENSTAILSAHKFGTNESASVLWQSDASATTYAVVTDGTRVYFTADDGLLRGVPVDGGAGFSIGPSSGAATAESLGVVLNGGIAYWTISDPSQGQVLGASTSNLSSYGIADQQQNPTWLAVDGTNVFWLTTLPSGTNINGCEIAACNPTVLATAHSPHAIVVDDAAVYWSDPAGLGPFGGAVFKLAK